MLRFRNSMPLAVMALFLVTLWTGCSDPPEACFTVVSTLVDQNEDVTFTNCSQFQDKGYFWEFGDGTTSNTVSPIHKYINVGTYQVVLTAKGKTSELDDSVSEIIRTGTRKLREIEVTTLPALNPSGGAWDPSDAPDVVVVFMHNGQVMYQSGENTDLTLGLPYTIDASGSNLTLTPDTWSFAVIDADGGGLADTMAIYSVNLNNYDPEGLREIKDDATTADFTIRYNLE